MDQYAALKAAVETAELVDAHAHNIVALDSTFPFISCFSEATGDALSAVPHTINFKRSLKEISQLYGANSSLDVVQEYRSNCGLESVTSKCLAAAGISAVLIDNGLQLDKMLNIEWHKNFFPYVGRILRIEHVAERILGEGSPGGAPWTLDLFTKSFLDSLKSHADKVVGFKSIAAYRSGLEINTNVSEKDAEEGLNEVLRAGKPVRIANKNFIDHIFIRALEVAQSFDLPLQIHTGFGDKDLDLRLSNPLHLRSLLEDNRFSKSRIVLLHASYPFSKEASYLASVYSQVYLDFGLAVPKLSFHGMISSVKELLELAPIKKVMFSTDACGFPESYYLGAKKAREVIFSVLRDACINEDLSVAESIVAVKDIFSENARNLYKITTVSKSVENGIAPLSVKSGVNTSAQGVAFVRILWVDASGQHRCRVVPKKRFHDVVTKNGVGLTCASMAMSSHMDGPADGTNLTGVGEISLIPDLSTKRLIPWAKEQEMVLADMHLKPGTPWEYCPRDALRRVSKILKEEFNLVMNVGFENEFFLLRSVQVVDGKENWLPIDATPYCSAAAADAAFPILSEIMACLQSLNISVEQLHAESGNGQFEFAFVYTNCKNSADNIVFAREAIRAVARKHGLLATFVPKYSLADIGSGSHVHISLSENGQNVFMGRSGETRYGISKVGEEFMAGVLDHLPSILAFTAPVPNSYDRIQPNTWSGAYLCWGVENKEAPLRAASPPGTPDGSVSNFEIKAFDGCANPHLGLAAIMAAGIDGLRRKLALPEPIDCNPHDFKDKVARLPKSLAESVEALEKDTVLRDLIGEKLLVAIIGVRKAEVKYYSENKDAWKNLIYKY
ncbi:protein fluG-like [Salvia splendens]|uniref:protein fluG-like n=1 Tax=Salvia splendens TaxID=180675 RepID=UPI001C279391|nr:protein fluG-like [Salvia splendens]